MDKTHLTYTVLRLALLAIALQACLSLKIKCKRQRLEFCNFAGFRKTTATNLVEQGDQEQVALDQRFKNLKLLSQTGCSDLVRPFACSIFAPVCHKKFGMLPPCKSLCEKVKSGCKRFLKLVSKKQGSIDCSYFSEPGKNAGCVE